MRSTDYGRYPQLLDAKNFAVDFSLCPVATETQSRFQIKIIEVNEERAKTLGAGLDHALVLIGDATDEQLLASEGIEDMDIVLALTNDDEGNILSALLAKYMGARRVLALINRRAYADLLPIGCAVVYRDGTFATFVTSLLACVAVGALVVIATRRHLREFKSRDGFILVAAAWTLTAAIHSRSAASRPATPASARSTRRSSKWSSSSSW